jgi:hypothetical protein
MFPKFYDLNDIIIKFILLTEYAILIINTADDAKQK